jgi:predicted DNA-binding transcriptional regulator AlpA
MSEYLHNQKLVRLNSIIGKGGVLPLSAATWWSGVRKGYYPPPVRLGPRITAWKVSDIEALIQNGFNEDAQSLQPQTKRKLGCRRTSNSNSCFELGGLNNG